MDGWRDKSGARTHVRGCVGEWVVNRRKSLVDRFSEPPRDRPWIFAQSGDRESDDRGGRDIEWVEDARLSILLMTLAGSAARDQR